ncbi:hypothetical protein A3Q56_02159 [Intoshia linei]|uniref:Histone acetyltransferase n=1 Tax=Intoshia linei TaxID=1819745 RepID=A0A177B723_9BILA|nr:hypothetical protein A3Q56_02159 [Intoshia linei]
MGKNVKSYRKSESERPTQIKQNCIKIEHECALNSICKSNGSLTGQKNHACIGLCPIYHNQTLSDCENRIRFRNKLKDSNESILSQLTKLSQGVDNETSESNQDLIESVLPKLDHIVSKTDLDFFLFTQSMTLDEYPDYVNFFRQPNQYLNNFNGCSKLETLPYENDPFFKIKHLKFHNFEISVFYPSPFPQEFTILPKIFMCQCCLNYTKSLFTMERHQLKCKWNHPPGTEIYRHDNLSFFEIDGNNYKLYCQNLCLLGKLFLDHKTLYYDVEPFLFYVLTIYENNVFNFIGYFSKEKESSQNYNVSCILILPPYMKKGYGQYMIDFSYLLSKSEQKIGTPEKPLSDLGLLAYRKYWMCKIDEYLKECKDKKTVSIKDISCLNFIESNDIVSTLQYFGRIKYWRGKHIILKPEKEEESNIQEKLALGLEISFEKLLVHKILFRMLCKMLLTEASVERAFSKHRHIHNYLRANLSTEKLNDQLFIRYNWEKFYE